MGIRLALTIVLSFAASPFAAGAQLRYGADLSFITRYEWRGITRGSGASLQPAFHVGVGTEWSFRAGVWSNIQLAGTQPDRGFGFRDRWFGEVSPWAELSRSVGALDLGVGWTGYLFDHQGGVAPGAPPVDTHEIYGRVRALGLPTIVPAIEIYHDVDAVRGTYVEPGVSLRLPVWQQAVLPIGSLFLTAKAGISLGQETATTSPGESGHFGERGLTHWDLGFTLPVATIARLGPVELSPVLEGHLQLNRDPVTRLKTSDGGEDGTTWWFRFVVSASGPRCRPDRAVCI